MAIRINCPTFGIRRKKRSRTRRPRSVFVHRKSAATTTTNPSVISFPHALVKLVNPTSIRVGSGNSASNESKNVLNRGSTNPDRTATVTIDITPMTAG